MDQLDHQLEDTGPRHLSAPARCDERDLIQAITKRIRPDAKGIVPLLVQEIPELLHRLEMITKQDGNRFAAPETHRQLIDLIARAKQMRSVVAEGFDEIRNHLESQR